MATLPKGSISVIFVARRNDGDEVGYTAAAARMETLAAMQPGYLGIDSVRGTTGLGITVSYWTSDAAATAWRDQIDHVAIREKGRGLWYESYSLHIAEVIRSYDWTKL